MESMRNMQNRLFYRIFSWQWRNDANAHDDDRRNRNLVYNRQLHREYQARTIAILIEETESLFKLGNLLLSQLLNHRACFILWACSKLCSSLYLLSSRVCVRCRHTQYLLCCNRSSGGGEKKQNVAAYWRQSLIPLTATGYNATKQVDMLDWRSVQAK